MYYLGIDAGGTKTEAIVVDDTGKELGRGMGGAANYHSRKLGDVVASVCTAAWEATNNAHITAKDLTATCLGIAAYDTPHDKKTLNEAFIKEQDEFFGPNLTIVNDAVIGLYSGTTSPGVCLISGTGCNCYGVGKEGQQWFAGNWSYLMGDQGGGYHLALRIFRAVLKEFDGRGEKTVLTQLVLSKLGVASVFELIDWVYSKNPAPGDIASFAALLDEALKQNDLVSQTIFREHIIQLTIDVEAVVRRVGLNNEKFDVVLIGSFFKTVGAVDTMQYKIQKYAPQANLVFPKVSPAIGATILAKERANK